MDSTIPVYFDGQVFRPEEPPKLATNRRYIVTVTNPQDTAPSATPTYPLSELLALATDMGRTDLTQRHGDTLILPWSKIGLGHEPLFLDTAYVYALVNTRDQ